MAETEVEKFGPNNGRIVGGVGLVAVVAAVIAIIADGRHGSDPLAFSVLALVALLIWLIMFRPGVRSDGTTLELRNMTSTTSVPLAQVEKVDVGAMLLVKSGGKVYKSIAVSRPRKRQRAGEGGSFVGARGGSHQHSFMAGSPKVDPSKVYTDFVEGRIRHLAEEARAHRRGEGDVVRRTWAWPEIAALAALSVLALVLWMG
jgi:hypothetical protein